MRRILALFLALIMVLSLAACGSKESGIRAEDKLNKLPTKQETPEKAEEPEEPKPEETEKPDKPDKEKPEKGGKTEEELVDPEPSQGLAAYDNPCDHLDSFTDVGKVSAWAKPALTAMVEKEIINGINGQLQPQGNVTRAQVAKMLYAMQ